jgi:hypothetical protein
LGELPLIASGAEAQSLSKGRRDYPGGLSLSLHTNARIDQTSQQIS